MMSSSKSSLNQQRPSPPSSLPSPNLPSTSQGSPFKTFLGPTFAPNKTFLPFATYKNISFPSRAHLLPQSSPPVSTSPTFSEASIPLPSLLLTLPSGHHLPLPTFHGSTSPTSHLDGKPRNGPGLPSHLPLLPVLTLRSPRSLFSLRPFHGSNVSRPILSHLRPENSPGPDDGRLLPPPPRLPALPLLPPLSLPLPPR